RTARKSRRAWPEPQPSLLRVVRQVGGDGDEKALGRDGDLVDCPLERGLVLGSGLAETAHLAHELARGGADLLVGSDVVGMAQSLDASTHARNDRRRRVSGGGAAAARAGSAEQPPAARARSRA